MSATPRKQRSLLPSAAGPFLVFKSPQGIDCVFRFYEVEAVGRWFDEFGEIGIRVQVAGVPYLLSAELEPTLAIWQEYAQGRQTAGSDS